MDPLYIQIINGQPINHPAFESNLIAAFGAVPSDWEAFVKSPRPNAALYQMVVPAQPPYVFLNGVWTDVWDVREMTHNEKVAMQQPVKDVWAARPYASNFSAWTYDEASNSYRPPIPRPTDGQNWRWSGAELNWKVAPIMPDDGNQYKFDFDNWAWVQVTQGT